MMNRELGNELQGCCFCISVFHVQFSVPRSPVSLSRKRSCLAAMTKTTCVLALLFSSGGCSGPAPRETAPVEWIQSGAGGRGFVFGSSGRRFTPWGFNYDHDERERLLEDY